MTGDDHEDRGPRPRRRERVTTTCATCAGVGAIVIAPGRLVECDVCRGSGQLEGAAGRRETGP